MCFRNDLIYGRNLFKIFSLKENRSMKIQEKLIKFEKYIKRTRFNYANSKSNMVWKFHELFMEEMMGTETGDKFRKKLK